MPGATTTDHPFLIPTESGADGIPEACAIREFPDRSPTESAGANFAPMVSTPPENLWFLRLADWLPASPTQPRSDGSKLADGGTIFFDGVDDFPAELHSNSQASLPPFDSDSPVEERFVLWMRAGDPVLRTIAIGGAPQMKGPKLIPESAETFAPEEDSQRLRSTDEIPPACPLAVWTLWSNPRHG